MRTCFYSKSVALLILGYIILQLVPQCCYAIPVINIESWINPDKFTDLDRDLAAQEWDRVMSSLGFVIITGHGITSVQVESLKSDAEMFFSSDISHKNKFIKGKYGNPEGGYTPLGFEAVARSLSKDIISSPDLVESFVFTSVPDNSISPMPAAYQYFKSMETLSLSLLRLSSAALGLDDVDFFCKFYDPRRFNSSKNSFGVLRVAYYPSMQQNSTENNVRYGQHTDYQGFTILRADPSDWADPDGGGLEVKAESILKPDGVWLPIRISTDPASHKDAPLIINAGDLIQRWTNDRWRSNLHRVVAPSVNSSTYNKSRLALVFFTGPMDDAIISPLPINGPPKYSDIRSGDHLNMKIGRSQVSDIDVVS